MKKNKSNLYVVILLIFIISILGALILNYVIKNSKNGNNINSQEIVEDILNINFYKSKITVQVNSNKNSNKYILYQEYSMENGSIQEVIEPENIAGIKITRKDGNITVENTNLSLSTIFENYKGLEENNLDLICFIENYKNNNSSSFEENDIEIIMKTKNSSENKYTEYKILYINKETKLPTKLIIEDNNKNTTINIQYNEIGFV